MSRLALVAGRGALPGILADALGRDRADWFAGHLAGAEPVGVGQSRGFRIEHLGSFIAHLRANGVTRVCFAGAIERPILDPSAVDVATRPLVARMVEALRSGDDAALRTVVAFFEEAGLEVVGAQDIAPGLLDLPVTGVPGPRDRADIVRAAAVHAALASVDVGQGCVVAAGQVLAVEASPGTDWMLDGLARGPVAPVATAPPGLFGGDILGGAADWLSGGGRDAAPAARGFPRPDGGVFFKAAKPGQDRRIDLPVIGAGTARRVAAAGLSGIAVERGGVLVLDRADLVATLADRDLFLVAWERRCASS